MNAKIVQVTSGWLFLGVGIFFLLFTLATNCLVGFGREVNNNIWIWILVTLIICVFIDAGIWWIQEDGKINIDTLKKSMPNTKDTISSVAKGIAISGRFVDSGKSLFFAFLFILIIVIFVIKYYNQDLSFHPNNLFYTQLITIPIYFLLIRRLVIKFVSSLRAYVEYEILPESIKLKLPYRNFSELNKKYFVQIRFDELNEIKQLSYAEAQSMIDYMIGPNLTLQMAATTDEIKYIQGKITRPNYYLFGPAADKILILKGKNIYYLISVKQNDCSDLINAFKKYKSEINQGGEL